MKGLKLCMKMEYLNFLDSVSFLPCSFRKLPEAYGLSFSKSWYSDYFNTEGNLNYICPVHDVPCYGVNEMSEEERKEFLLWYENRKSTIVAYCKPILKLTSPY